MLAMDRVCTDQAASREQTRLAEDERKKAEAMHDDVQYVNQFFELHPPPSLRITPSVFSRDGSLLLVLSADGCSSDGVIAF